MKTRKALEEPDRFIALHWGSRDRCPCAAVIDELVAQWRALKPEYKSLQADKGTYSRQIGDAKAEGVDPAELKEKVAQVAVRIRALEEERKALETALESLLEPPPITLPDQQVPQRFQPWRPDPASGPIRVCECSEDDQQRWDAYVTNHPHSALYHLYGWRDLITRSFDHETHYWSALDEEGRVVGILPLVRLQSRLFGDFSVSLPYFNYGGVLASSEEARAALLAKAGHYGNEAGLSHVELRHTSAIENWAVREDKASMVLRLPTSKEELSKRIGSKVRAQVRQAQKHNHTVEIGGADLLDSFYQVFARNMRDLGTPVYSKIFFANILEQWQDRTSLVVVRVSGRPVAAAFLIGYKEMLEIPWASTLRSANAMNMNMLLYWEVLSLAIKQGYDYFDFGRSSVEAGTYQFKKQWGAKPVQHFWHYWLPEGAQLPRLSPDNPKYRLAIACWRKLPLAVTTSVGPHIVKHLP